MAGTTSGSKAGTGRGKVRAPRAQKPSERRASERFPVRDLRVDLRSGETFLYAYVDNISEMGIFVASDNPLPAGSKVVLRLPGRGGSGDLTLNGTVRWVNPPRPEGRDPGMGIGFDPLSESARERVVDLVRAVAYLTRD